MRASSQEREDEEETELSQEYRIHQFPPEPTRCAFDPLDLVGLGVIGFVGLAMMLAVVLGLIAEVRFFVHLFR